MQNFSVMISNLSCPYQRVISQPRS